MTWCEVVRSSAYGEPTTRYHQEVEDDERPVEAHQEIATSLLAKVWHVARWVFIGRVSRISSVG